MMKYWFYRIAVVSLFQLLLPLGNSEAGSTFNPHTNRPDKCVTVEEEDGSPSMVSCQRLEVTSGTLTDDGDGAFSLSTGGGGGNSFETIATPAGTSPVADSSTDTLTVTEAAGIDITGTAGTDTLDVAFDPTEITGNRTWDDGTTSAQDVWTWNLSSGTDPTITFFDNRITLTANASVSGTLSLPSLTAGSVPFIGSLGVITEDNTNLFWDDTDDGLAIGTTGIATSGNQLRVYRNTLGTTTPQLLLEEDGTGDPTLSWLLTAGDQWVMGLDTSQGELILANASALAADTGAVQTWFPTGDAVTFGTSVDLGGKVNIDGTADEIQLQIQANSSQTANVAVIENSSGTDLWSIDGSGNILFGTSAILSGGNSASIVVPTSASPTTASEARVAFDNNAWATGRGALQVNDGTANGYGVAILASDTCTNGQVAQFNTNGTWTCETSSGSDTNADKEFVWPAGSPWPLDAAESWSVLAKDTGTNLDNFVLDFDQTTDECRTVAFTAPPDITSGGTVTFGVIWYSASVTTNEVVWDFRHNSGVAEGVDLDQALTTVAAAADTVQGTAGQVTMTTWTETQTNLAWAASDLVVGEFCRDANHADDDFAADARAVILFIRVPRS